MSTKTVTVEVEEISTKRKFLLIAPRWAIPHVKEQLTVFHGPYGKPASDFVYGMVVARISDFTRETPEIELRIRLDRKVPPEHGLTSGQGLSPYHA